MNSPASPPEADNQDDAYAVARRLAALPELAMRVASLAELVARSPPREAAWLLDAIATAGRAGGPPFDLSLIAAVDLFNGERLDYDLRRQLYTAADEMGLEACKELLYSAELTPEDPELASRPRALVPGARPLTLGERKSLARTWKREVLDRLLLDPSLDVVALLLENPRLTEDDALKLATARRASGGALMLLLQHRRWNCRPRVRRALLRNPRLPEAAAVRLVALLNRPETEELVRDPALPERVHVALRRRLAPRHS